MAKVKKKPKFAPAAPIRLKRLWKTYPAFNQIARYLHVNPAYVYKAMILGKLPANENIRVKFGLPRRARIKHPIKPVKQVPPEHVKWWRRLDKLNRDEIIHLAWLSTDKRSSPVDKRSSPVDKRSSPVDKENKHVSRRLRTP